MEGVKKGTDRSVPFYIPLFFAFRTIVYGKFTKWNKNFRKKYCTNVFFYGIIYPNGMKKQERCTNQNLNCRQEREEFRHDQQGVSKYCNPDGRGVS